MPLYSNFDGIKMIKIYERLTLNVSLELIQHFKNFWWPQSILWEWTRNEQAIESEISERVIHLKYSEFKCNWNILVTAQCVLFGMNQISKFY